MNLIYVPADRADAVAQRLRADGKNDAHRLVDRGDGRRWVKFTRVGGETLRRVCKRLGVEINYERDKKCPVHQ